MCLQDHVTTKLFDAEIGNFVLWRCILQHNQFITPCLQLYIGRQFHFCITKFIYRPCPLPDVIFAHGVGHVLMEPVNGPFQVYFPLGTVQIVSNLVAIRPGVDVFASQCPGLHSVLSTIPTLFNYRIIFFVRIWIGRRPHRLRKGLDQGWMASYTV
ncbi:hypothetical protein ASPFODRAFT_460840 [Aspergillus luchuensis CBS 106.47]|uniref:Uncharacterized protein n=1 Tax=Aspergillus luchuensis (strain CBS 106.47) TaxID=1137211 RepID=A0A1M3T0T0_ASPLC|nr:hypothetical protein ASPFODRAFT_460840 [Aspergillus luchuensis CBS 106.47]